MPTVSIPPYLLSALQVAPYPMSKGRLLAYASAFGASTILVDQLSELPVTTFFSFEDLAGWNESIDTMHRAERLHGPMIRINRNAANPVIDRGRNQSGL